MNDLDLVLLDDICKEMFGLSKQVARRRAALGTLVVPAFRLGDGRRGPLYVKKSDVAALVVKRHSAAASVTRAMARVT